MTISRKNLLARLEPSTIIEFLQPYIQPERMVRFRSAIASRLEGIWLVVENLYDPHNGAALIRTAEALGILHVVLIQQDSRLKLSRKITIGAERWMHVHEFDTTEKAASFMQSRSLVHLAAVAPPSEVANDHVTIRRPVVPLGDLEPPTAGCAIWFGNEREGLSQAAVDLADIHFTIPMAGLTRSLNLSVSAGIILHQVTGRLRNRLGRMGDLHDNAQEKLLAQYLLHSVDRPEALLRETMARANRPWPV